MDYLFVKKGFTKEDFILLGKSYSYAWFTIIATRIWQIMVISKLIILKKKIIWLGFIFFSISRKFFNELTYIYNSKFKK